MNIEKTTALFKKFEAAVQLLQKALNVAPVEALAETFDNLETGQIKVEEGAPDQETVAKLAQLYADLNYAKLTGEQRQQIFNLLVLKALNDQQVEPNLLPTPYVLATVIALVWRKLLGDQQVAVTDPAVGTGALLVSLTQQLAQANHSQNKLTLTGLDNDEDLLALSDINFHLAGLKADLYCQDALLPWLSQKPDAIVSDLPVGYYPKDKNAENFATRRKNGHSYTHVLYIEQIIKSLKPGGFAFLVIPSSLLNGKIANDFVTWLAEKVYLQALIELPQDLFYSKLQSKEILVFQNHGGGAKPKQVLAAKLASLKSPESLAKFAYRLDQWAK